MANTALNRTTQALLTNKSGGNLNYGDVVVLDNTNTNGFTTTTTSGLSTRGLGVILEPNGIANNASGMVAVGGWCPKINLNTAAAVGQFVKTHTVAGQGTPHASPQVEGDFAVALSASATPPCNLFGSPNGPLGGGAGTVTHTAGALTASAVVVGNGTDDVKVLASLGTTTTVLHGNAAGLPTFGAVSLTADVTGTLPVANGGSRVAQMVSTLTGAVATGGTGIPYDNSIPQNTEGDEFMTLAITPTNASSILKIEVVFVATIVGQSWNIVALFQDSTANALAAASDFHTVSTSGNTTKFTHLMTAGTTSATTFKVRAGHDSGGAGSTLTFNGQSGGRIFGGVSASSIVITEYLP